MIVDCHFHVMAQNDVEGCQLSREQRNELASYLAQALLGLLDERLLALLLHDPKLLPTSHDIFKTLRKVINGSRLVTGFVLLGLDDIYSTSGQKQKSHFVVTADYIKSIIKAARILNSKKQLYLGASVHPYDPHALDRIKKLCDDPEIRPVLIKWIPSSQLIDPQLPELQPFYELLAERNLPLLCHAGWEGAITVPKPKKYAHSLENPGRLRRALDAGVTVIVAHCAAPYFHGQPNMVPELHKMFEESEIGNKGWKLYADISALLLSPWRAMAVKEFIRNIDPDKLLYGSDFPIPTFDLTFEWLNSVKDRTLYRRAKQTKNLLDKDVLFKQSIGIPNSVFYNTAKVLNIPEA